MATQNTNEFISSLSSMSPKETGYDPKSHKRKRISKDGIIRSVLVCIFLGIFLYSSFSIFQRFMLDREADKTYSELAGVDSALSPLATVPTPDNLLSLYNSINLTVDHNTVTGSTDTDYNDPARYSKYRSGLVTLQKKYPDVYAWIVVTGTNIDYPVLKGPDNNFYLRRNYKGQDVNAGSIFVDYRLSHNYNNNLNTVVYGHNMVNGTMFRAIRNWFESANRNSVAESMRIEIYTADALYIYSPFSAYRADGNDFIQTSFASYDKYLEFLKMIRSRSVIPCDLPYDESSKIATLVTCTNNHNNEKERYVLHCLLTQVVKF